MPSKASPSPDLPPIPSPPQQDDKPEAWAQWLMGFLDWFIASWARFEETHVPIDDEYTETGEAPTKLKDQAPDFLNKAAWVITHFFGFWGWPESKDAKRAAPYFREAADLIRDKDYAELYLDEFKRHRRNLWAGLDRFGSSDGDRANRLDGVSADTSDGASASEEGGQRVPIKMGHGSVEATSEGSRTRHSKDFRSVHWYGEDYNFTEKQAMAVSEWWHAWKNGTPVLADATVITEIGLSVKDRARALKNLFDGNPAFGKMIVAGQRRGTHQLVVPLRKI